MKIFVFLINLVILFKQKGEFDFVEDVKDFEERQESQAFIHKMENLNVNFINEQQIIKASKNEIDNINKKFEKKLQKVIDNQKFEDHNVGPELIVIFGENFSNYQSAINDLIIDLKAQIEQQINLFFGYKCDVKQDVQMCPRLQSEIKETLMFNNFFEYGYQNQIQLIIEHLDKNDIISEEFLENLWTKLSNVKNYFFNLVQDFNFNKDFFIQYIKRKIEKRFGKGLNVILNVNMDGQLILSITISFWNRNCLQSLNSYSSDVKINFQGFIEKSENE